MILWHSKCFSQQTSSSLNKEKPLCIFCFQRKPGRANDAISSFFDKRDHVAGAGVDLSHVDAMCSRARWIWSKRMKSMKIEYALNFQINRALMCSARDNIRDSCWRLTANSPWLRWDRCEEKPEDKMVIWIRYWRLNEIRKNRDCCLAQLGATDDRSEQEPGFQTLVQLDLYHMGIWGWHNNTLD